MQSSLVLGLFVNEYSPVGYVTLVLGRLRSNCVHEGVECSEL